MPSSEMLRRLATVRTDISEERFASIIRAIRIGELGTKLAVSKIETRCKAVHCNIIFYPLFAF
jgi:hypothetical protein